MTREFSAKVPEEDYNRFVEITGGKHGATTWFITSALKAFNEKAGAVPTPPEQLTEAIGEVIDSFITKRKDEHRS